MHVAVTGATGLIGRPLVDALLARGDRVVALVRGPPRKDLPADVEQREWTTDTPFADLRGADAVVHLAGAPVAEGRWTAARKREIEESRVKGTRSVVEGIRQAGGSIRVLVSASGIDFYGDGEDEVQDEQAQPGRGFLPEVAQKWEAEARKAETLGVRVVLLRTGMVLAKDGGALEKMLPAFRLGFGGPLGHGRQFVPWIHVADEVGLILHALDREELRGPMVGAAPNPVRSRDFARALGEALGRPAVLPAPTLALRIAFGELASVILASHNARPRRALESGYRFRYPTVETALVDLT